MDPMGFIFGVGSHQRVKQILPFMRVPIRLWVLDGFEIARGSISFGRYIWGIWSPKIPTQTTNSPLITEISYPKNHWNLMHLPRHIEGFFGCVCNVFFWGGIYSPHQWLEIAWFLGLKKKQCFYWASISLRPFTAAGWKFPRNKWCFGIRGP